MNTNIIGVFQTSQIDYVTKEKLNIIAKCWGFDGQSSIFWRNGNFDSSVGELMEIADFLENKNITLNGIVAFEKGIITVQNNITETVLFTEMYDVEFVAN